MKSSLLLRLPTEVRELILRFAFGAISHVRLRSPSRRRLRPSRVAKDDPQGILSTCHLLREEAIPLFYSQTTLIFHCSGDATEYLQDAGIDPFVKSSITHLAMDDGDSQCMAGLLQKHMWLHGNAFNICASLQALEFRIYSCHNSQSTPAIERDLVAGWRALAADTTTTKHIRVLETQATYARRTTTIYDTPMVTLHCYNMMVNKGRRTEPILGDAKDAVERRKARVGVVCTSLTDYDVDSCPDRNEVQFIKELEDSLRHARAAATSSATAASFCTSYNESDHIGRCTAGKASSRDSGQDPVHAGLSRAKCIGLQGKPLGDQWFSMNNKAQLKIMTQIVDLETKFMAIPFAASGSLYHRKDLDRDTLAVPVSQSLSSDDGDCLVLGPTVKYEWWYQERALLLNINRGPWHSFRDSFEAPAMREINYCKTYGKPRLHVNRYLRELHGLQLHSPTDHIKLLNDVLKVSPYLELPDDHALACPVLRHPDLSPNNIIVNEDNDIVGIIDWQHAVILPLCLAASIPQHFQNWGDPVSEKLTQPEVKFPADFEQMDESEQEQIKERMRKRLVHFLYAALTMKQNPSHFNCISQTSLMTRAKVFSEASAPWEGDSVTLKNALFAFCRNWPLDKLKNGDVIVPPPEHRIPLPSEPPLDYTTEEVAEATDLYAQEQEKLAELAEMKDYIGIDSVRWVPDDASLERTVHVRDTIKAELLKQCESDLETEATEHHFPFQDFEDDGDD